MAETFGSFLWNFGYVCVTIYNYISDFLFSKVGDSGFLNNAINVFGRLFSVFNENDIHSLDALKEVPMWQFLLCASICLSIGVSLIKKIMF